MGFLDTSTGSPPRPGRRDRARRRIAALVCAAGSALAWSAGPTLLPAEQAFRLSARALDPSTLEVRYNVADGYYLYRDKLKFTIEPGPAAAAAPELPPGLTYEDAFFGKVVTYRGLVVLRVPVSGLKRGASFTLAAQSQGCADAGVCYPPQAQKVALRVPPAGSPPDPPVEPAPAKKSYFN